MNNRPQSKEAMQSGLWAYICAIEGNDLNGNPSGAKPLTVCKKIRTLYIEVLKPIVTGDDSMFYFDPSEGNRFADFCRRCIKQTTGGFFGQPLELLPFQRAKYDALLGIKWAGGPQKGHRRFTEVFDVRGRKNGKSVDGAAFSLYEAFNEKGGEIYIAASTLAQARKVWNEAMEMVYKNQFLSKRCHITTVNPTRISVPAVSSSIMALSHKPENLDGLNSNVVIIDEVHNLDREIYEVLKQSQSAWEQPILNQMTTAGFVRDGLYDDEYSYAAKVLEGEVEDYTLLPIIYEMDSPEEVNDEGMWIKANPALKTDEQPNGIKKVAAIRSEINRMKDDPNLRRTVLTKDFNIVASASSAYLSAEEIRNGEWGKYSREEVDSPKFWEQFKNKPVIGGYDLSMTNDLTAWVTLVPDAKKRCWIIRCQVWCSHDFLESETFKASKIQSAFKTWIEQGWIRVSSPSAVNEDGTISELGTHIINYDEVATYVKEEFDENGYFYNKIMNDPYRGSFLRQKLAGYGWGASVTEPVRQGFITLGEPTSTFQAYLKDKRITYLGNPVFKWMLSNATMVEDRNGNMVIDKSGKKSMNKIDGVDAAINCFVELIRNEDYYFSF